MASKPTTPGSPTAEPARADAAAPATRDRTHWLYIAVIVAVLLGIVVGFVFPDFAVGLK